MHESKTKPISLSNIRSGLNPHNLSFQYFCFRWFAAKCSKSYIVVLWIFCTHFPKEWTCTQLNARPIMDLFLLWRWNVSKNIANPFQPRQWFPSLNTCQTKRTRDKTWHRIAWHGKAIARQGKVETLPNQSEWRNKTKKNVVHELKIKRQTHTQPHIFNRILNE